MSMFSKIKISTYVKCITLYLSAIFVPFKYGHIRFTTSSLKRVVSTLNSYEISCFLSSLDVD